MSFSGMEVQVSLFEYRSVWYCPINVFSPAGYYTNWQAGEPNNYNNNEDCATQRDAAGGPWNDLVCTDGSRFAIIECEPRGQLLQASLNLLQRVDGFFASLLCVVGLGETCLADIDCLVTLGCGSAKCGGSNAAVSPAKIYAFDIKYTLHSLHFFPSYFVMV